MALFDVNVPIIGVVYSFSRVFVGVEKNQDLDFSLPLYAICYIGVEKNQDLDFSLPLYGIGYIGVEKNQDLDFSLPLVICS